MPPTVTQSAREAMGLDADEEPAFWPSGQDMSDPHALAYVASAEVWLSLGRSTGDVATSPIWILYGDPAEGFEWQSTGQQFADYGCRWNRLIAAYDQAEEDEP